MNICYYFIVFSPYFLKVNDKSAITIKTKEALKIETQEYFDELGINMSVAINLFLHDVVTNRRFSFSISDEPFGTLYDLNISDLSASST